jgi:hypothetical protein
LTLCSIVVALAKETQERSHARGALAYDTPGGTGGFLGRRRRERDRTHVQLKSIARAAIKFALEFGAPVRTAHATQRAYVGGIGASDRAGPRVQGGATHPAS